MGVSVNMSALVSIVKGGSVAMHALPHSFSLNFQVCSRQQ